MNSLTREQAIKRIIDIRDLKSVEHLRRGRFAHSTDLMFGAQLELMAIFDIKEEELK